MALIPAILAILAAPAPAVPAQQPAAETIIQQLQSIPFILNQGQIADQSVLYHARTFSGGASIKNDGSIVYVIPTPPDTAHNDGQAVAVIAEMLVNPDRIAPAGAEPAATRVHFLRGAPENWRTDTPCFHAVVMPGVYQGIDLSVRAHQNNIEKIFTVAPGADPARIRIQLAGITRLAINTAGELEVTTDLGIVRFTRPVAWQDALSQDAAPTRQPVAIAYAVDGHTFRFELGAYDTTRPLMIDPLLAGTFVGGSGADVMTAATLDAAGNVYAAGYTDSALDFPVTPGVITNYQGGVSDAVIAKFNPQMTELLAATFLGGAGEDQAMAAAFNPGNGMIYVGGMTDSTNFTGGVANFGGQDGFVLRLDTNLQNPLAIMLGGASDDAVRALAVNNNQIYAAGQTGSGDLNLVTPGAIQPALLGQTNAFVAVLHQAFNQTFCSATYLGGTAIDIADALTVDHANSIIVAGRTASADFPITNGVGAVSAQTASGGGFDAFIAKIGDDFSTYLASTYLGGTLTDAAAAVAVDISNNVYVAGYTLSANFPTPNIFGTSYRTTAVGASDIFATRLSPELTNFQASTYLGGTSNDAALALTVISDTNSTAVYLAGYTYSPDFPVTPNVYDRTFNGGADICMARFDDTFTNLLNATYLGGASDDGAMAMCPAADSNSLYVAGSTASTAFPIPGAGAQPEYMGGTADGFIVRMAASMQYGGLKWKYNIRDYDPLDGQAYLTSPTMGWDGTIYAGGGTNLYALNPDGSLKWVTGLIGRVCPPGASPMEFSGAVPAVGTNGTIYVGASSTPAGISRLYAINPEDGGINWSYLSVGSIYDSPAIGPDGSIYYGTYANYVHAVNPEGTEKWTRSFSSTIFSASPAINTNGVVYVIGQHNPDGGILYAMNEGDGTTAWSWGIPGGLPGRSSPLIASNGMLYVCGGSNLYALIDEGSTCSVYGTWTTTNTIASSPAIDSNNMVYVGSGNNLYSFNGASAGIVNWSRPVIGAVTSSPAIGSDGLIYVGGLSNIYAFTADGQTNWDHQIEDTGGLTDIRYQSPLIGTDGTVYMSDTWYIYALYGEVPPDQNSAWSTFGHDVLRTGNAGFDPRRYAAPTGVTASKGTYLDRITVTWDALPNVIHYEVWRSTTNDPATSTRIRQTLQTNLTDTAIVPGEIYYYWLRAKTHVVVLSDFSIGDHGCTPPLPPTGVNATKGWPDYTNYVAVTWQSSENAVLYNLYRAYDNDTNAAAYIASLSVTNYDDFSVTSFPGRSHYYWVSAANTDGVTNYFSAWSVGDGVTNAGGIPPDRPLNLTAGKGLTSTNVPLAWDAVPYATAYVIYRHTASNDPAGAQAIFTNGMQTTYNDGGTSPFKPYYYWLRATNQYGYSIYSDSDYGFTVLRPPLSVTASVNQTNRVNVSWEIESTNAHSYLIYRGISTNPADATFLAEIAFNSAADTNFTDFGISLGSEYYYFVRGRNAYGTSAHSPPSNLGGTYPLPPTGVEATDGTDASLIQVTWSASPSAGTRGYRIYRATTADPNFAGYIGSTSGTRVFDDAGGEPGQRYYYWVTATNYLGASVFSGLNSGWRPLAAPALVAAGNGDSTSLIPVTWSASRNANRYEVWRNTGNSTSTAEKLENDWTATTYNDSGVPAGVVYYYWVKAKNNQFVSAFSTSASGFRALGAADLAAQVLLFKPNVLAPDAQPEAVSFQVANLGPRDMSAPNSWITADFYLSTAPVLVEEDAHWMGGLTLNMPMAAGASSRYTLTQTDLRNLNVPALPEGAYYAFVFARHTLPSMWNDPNLANNHVRRTGNALRVNLTGGARQLWNDYDGDGKSDPVVYRAADGLWRGWFSGNNYQEVQAPGFGAPGCVPVPGDYDGDGRTDPAVYRDTDGLWRGWLSGSGYRELSAAGLGAPGCVPVPGDYDGDGRTDPAVYRDADGLWRGWMSGSGYRELAAPGFGAPGAYPAPGGYDYDAKTDPAVYALSGGNWRLWLSTHGYAEYGVAAWGGNGLLPVPGDYTGDGLTDMAIYHTATGYWFIRTLAGAQVLWGMHWGGENYLPVPGDYDGDGVMDLAVYHQPTGRWFVQTTAGGVIANGVTLGAPDFVPAAGILYP